jgi:hydrogenase/urease accessory protein HupE
VRSRVFVAAILCAVYGHAHEIGATRVETFLGADAYRVRITTDALTLLNKLETEAGLPRSRSFEPLRLVKLQVVLLRHCAITFDDHRVTPRAEIIVNGPGTSIDLEGRIPQRAKTFRWSYELAYGSYNLTVHNEGDPQPTRQWLDADERSQAFPLRPRSAALTRWRVAALYLRLGFTHIVPMGLDHILFVLGVFLLSTRLRDILSQVTAFTVAHSITLALTMYGLVSLSPRVVEPMIAISIMYVAIENLFTAHINRWRLLLVFAFGLLHGMGFAGVLHELGLPRSEFLTALVTFNAGLEMGQLSVIAVASLALASWARHRQWYRARVVVPISLAIAVTGLYWTVQRLAV